MVMTKVEIINDELDKLYHPKAKNIIKNIISRRVMFILLYYGWAGNIDKLKFNKYLENQILIGRSKYTLK